MNFGRSWRESGIAHATLSLLVSIVLVLALSASGSRVALSDTYPSRVVRIITGSAGGDADFLARSIAIHFGRMFGQQFIVENNGAAGGTIGTAQCARAAPDGYTLCIGHLGTHGSAPSLIKDLPYDPLRDFAPISQLTSAPIVLVAHPKVDAPDLKKLVALARSSPDKLSYASAGIGTASQLSGDLFTSRLGLSILHVPYKGAGGALTSVLAGETDLSFLSLATGIAHIREGKIRGLAVLSRQRSPVASDVPTALEQGFDNVEATAWFGLFAPAGVDEAHVSKLNQALAAILSDPNVRQALVTRGSEPSPSKPNEFAQFVSLEIEKWKQVIAASNQAGR